MMKNKRLTATRHYDANEVDAIVAPIIIVLRRIVSVKDPLKREKMAVECSKQLADMINFRGYY